MKHLTDKERDFLVGLTESIQELTNANAGILSVMNDLKNNSILDLIPHTQTIGKELTSMLMRIKNYSQVTEKDLNAVS